MTPEEKALESNKKLKIIRENELDFLYDLYMREVPLDDANVQKLRKAGYFGEHAKQVKEKVVIDNINHELLKFKTDKNNQADQNIDIIQPEVLPDKIYEILTSDELAERSRAYGHIFEGGIEITSKDWKPKSHIYHEQDFVDWIDSINNKGFFNKIYYRKFSLYCQQAYQWLSENKTVTDFDDDEEREEYKQNELARCDENVLYFLNKYAWYKDANAEDGSGEIKYIARPIHEFMAYMEDCEYSDITAKGRQIAASTTIMSIKVRNVILKTNWFLKFISENDDKAIEIFEDKLKYPYYRLPGWMRPIPLNERDNLFAIGYKKGKGTREGAGSKIEIAVPKRTAVAGGSPNEVDIDEGGNIANLGLIVGNIRPTSYFYNPNTGKLELRRRLKIWGTGGAQETGGKAFETEYMAIKKAWDERDWSVGIVPIFFDWTCRPGATQKHYDDERRQAYRKAENPGDPKGKQHITEFHQSWPTSLSDVFRTNAKTLLDDEYIEQALKRIRDAKIKNGFTLHQSGYFEPIFDFDSPMPEGSDTDFKIIGTNFIPTADNDARMSTTIFLSPNKQWLDRYYQGTDPIDTDTGLSDFASTIWDDYFNCPAAIMHSRQADYPKLFLQSMMLGIHYDDVHGKGIRELLESNRGSAYYQYILTKGYGKRCVANYELPEYLQNRTAKNEGIGIDSHGDRTNDLVNIQFSMFNAYGQNFYHEILFEQSKTFVFNLTDKGKKTWGPINKKYYKDDTLWSTTYSYICAKMCYNHIQPKNIETLQNTTKIVHKLVRGKDNTLRGVTVKQKVYGK